MASIRILLIEDNESHSELIKISLMKLKDIDLIITDTLKEGQSYIDDQNNVFDLIITDIRLPDGDGVEFFTSNKSIEKYPFIVMTSFGDETRAVNALKAGFVDYIVKSDKSLLGMDVTVERALRELIAVQKTKKAEEALRLSEKKYRNIFNHSPIGIYRFDNNGFVQDANPKFLKMLGYESLDEIEKITINDFFKDSQERKDHLDTVINSSEVHGREFKLIKKDKSEIIVIEYTQAVKDANNNILFFDCTVEDITERKLSEELIKANEARFREVIDLVPHSIFAKNEKGRILLANKAFANQINLNVDDVLGRLDSELIPNSANLKSYREHDQVVFQNDESLFIPEEKHTSPSGEESVYQTTKIPFKNWSSKGKALLGVSVDITEKIKADAELLRVSKLESLGTLAGGIAHNFKNILAAINLTLGFAKMKNEMNDEFFNKMDKLVNQATALATRFETYTTGGEPIKEVIGIKKLASEASDLALSGSNCTGNLIFDENLLNVEVDPKQINEVLMNLLINAKQAMENGGTVSMRASNVVLDNGEIQQLEAGDYVKLVVEDQGVGIPTDIVSSIFDPFFTTKPEGKGLGLSSVHFIISKHNGHINVESELGHGTSFTIYLPASKKNESIQSNDISKAKRGHKDKVLVMDDDDMVRESLIEFGDYLDYEIIGSRHGEEAAEIYKEHFQKGSPFKAVILDLTVKGGLGGEETIKILKEIDPNVKGIVFSAHSTKPIMANFQDYGFSAKLAKPATLNQIADCLASLIP